MSVKVINRVRICILSSLIIDIQDHCSVIFFPSNSRVHSYSCVPCNCHSLLWKGNNDKRSFVINKFVEIIIRSSISCCSIYQSSSLVLCWNLCSDPVSRSCVQECWFLEETSVICSCARSINAYWCFELHAGWHINQTVWDDCNRDFVVCGYSNTCLFWNLVPLFCEMIPLYDFVLAIFSLLAR